MSAPPAAPPPPFDSSPPAPLPPLPSPAPPPALALVGVPPPAVPGRGRREETGKETETVSVDRYKMDQCNITWVEYDKSQSKL